MTTPDLDRLTAARTVETETPATFFSKGWYAGENLEPQEPPANGITNGMSMSPMGWDGYLEQAANTLVELTDTVHDLSRKAEAAGVLYGETLYRELDIVAAQIHSHRRRAFSAVLTGRRMAEEDLRRHAAVISEYAEDQRRSMDTLERLSTRLTELEQLATPEIGPPPTERSATVLGHITEYLGLVTLTPDEAAWLRTAIAAYLDGPQHTIPADPATPEATPEPHAAAAARWANLARAIGEPVDENLALALVAVRAERGLPLEPWGDIAARAWLAWARAGFHGTPPLDDTQ